ncbi:hypothetical protein [Streptomyces sp. NRRL B-1140]|uniref:hypothetical protein n=1 Tax=Streptomyces sp. NRRL B-1140 TaxID=1415549 RepID=UPI00131C9D8F|nr:hypothetical protein [Streptomyces sp. NRRL B-1140]
MFDVRRLQVPPAVVTAVVVRPVRGPEPFRVISAAVRETALEQPALCGLPETLWSVVRAVVPPDGPGRTDS